MKRRIVLFLALILAVSAAVQPVQTQAASELDKIKKQIASLKDNMKSVEETKKSVQQNQEYVAHQKQVTTQSINEIMAQIEGVTRDLEQVDAQIKATEESLLQAGKELVDAEGRIDSRDQLLQSRVRLMYTSGFVSYMDVLLSATSFADFLDRFDSLQSILSQDKDILEDHKHDKALIIAKKAEIEKQLGDVKAMYEKKSGYHELLLAKEREKERMVLKFNTQMANLEAQEEELELLSEEQEQQLMALAKKQADLIKAEQAKKKKKKKAFVYTGGKLGMPVKDYSRLSSNFGTRKDPFTGRKRTHNGIDFAAPQGTDIFAAESGTVLIAQEWSGYGNCIIIDHGNGLWTVYAHIRNGGIKVEKGQTVKRGQKIAEVGSTGRSTGPHLHFEVRKNEQPVDPIDYLK